MNISHNNLHVDFTKGSNDNESDKNDPVMTMLDTKNASTSEKRAELWKELEIGPYKKFIQDCEEDTGLKGKLVVRPSTSNLICKNRFGKPDLNHQFYADVVFEHIKIFIIKSNLLDEQSLYALYYCHPLYKHLGWSIKLMNRI